MYLQNRDRLSTPISRYRPSARSKDALQSVYNLNNIVANPSAFLCEQLGLSVNCTTPLRELEVSYMYRFL